jgi:GT2 family glycosyltransferase
MLVSIIMPIYNKYWLAHNRMFEMLKVLPENCEIILVNDGSEETDVASGSGWWQKHGAKHPVIYIEHEKNMGFGASVNDGMKVAHGDIVIEINDDVIIKSDFVTEVVTLIQDDNKVLVGGELLTTDTGWNVIDGKICPYLNGWLLACTKEAWKELGGFDPIFGISDAEDIDISLTALSKGFKLVQLEKSNLTHMGGMTAGADPNRIVRTNENIKKLNDKWTGRLDFLDG